MTTHRSFKLTTVSKIVPDEGETLGHFLKGLADEKAPKANAHYRSRIADLYDLASDAFIFAANASIGYSRARRYEELANVCDEASAALRKDKQPE